MSDIEPQSTDSVNAPQTPPELTKVLGARVTPEQFAAFVQRAREHSPKRTPSDHLRAIIARELGEAA